MPIRERARRTFACDNVVLWPANAFGSERGKPNEGKPCPESVALGRQKLVEIGAGEALVEVDTEVEACRELARWIDAVARKGFRELDALKKRRGWRSSGGV